MLLTSGGGVTLDEFTQTLSEFYPNWAKKRIELGIPLDAFVLISVGELNTNKNNKVIISALERFGRENIHYVLCGIGDQYDSLQKQVNVAGLRKNVHFFGFRKDVMELYEMADCFVMSSLREGLSRSIMEAMASGLPCIVSDIRGNRDLISNGINGFLCCENNPEDFRKSINKLACHLELKKRISDENVEHIKAFSKDVVEQCLKKVYSSVLFE